MRWSAVIQTKTEIRDQKLTDDMQITLKVDAESLSLKQLQLVMNPEGD